MEAFIKMVMEFIVKLLELVGENVPSFITDWVNGLDSEEETTEPTA